MLPVTEERRIVTVLAADIGGSTALADRLDPEQVKLVIGDAIAIAIAAIERFGGTIKDLAGDGVLALFGPPVAHEDDAERALMAALATARAMRDYSQQVSRSFAIEGFHMRIGVSTGPVVVGTVGAGGHTEFGAVGDAVNIAARLQAAAGPGEVLAAEATYRVASDSFDWGAPRELQLKGKSSPVRAYPVLGLATVARRAEPAPSPVRGRSGELSALASALDRVSGRRGGVIFIVGEPGIGKSRLAGEARAQASAREGFLWLDGRCASYGESVPYWLFRDLLRDWLGVSAADPELRVRVELRKRLESLFQSEAADIYPYLARLIDLSLEGDSAGRILQLSPESLQYRTFEVVAHLLERLAGQSPLVVALDDLHWADATSILLVERLLPLMEKSAMLLIAAMRPDRDHSSWRLRQACEGEFPHLYQEMRLQPLSSGEDQRLLHSLPGGDTLRPDLEARLLQYAEGNPFYLEEMLRSALDGDGGDGTMTIPETIGAAIMARVDRLDPASRTVLSAASALGRSFRVKLLSAVAEQPQDAVDSALHRLQRLDLLSEERRWPEPELRFKHALIQEAVYESLVGSTRASLHRRAAEWLEEEHRTSRETVYGVLARHWQAAQVRGKAIEFLVLAGDRARDQWALDEAIGHYRDLVPLLRQEGRGAEAAETLFKLAHSLHTAMRYEEANSVWREAFEVWQPASPIGPPTALLRIASPMLAVTPDPFGSTAWTNIQLCMQIYDRVVEAWPSRNVVPSLAERWEVSDDGLRYLFQLHDAMTWHDGTPLTASDIESAIKRELDPERPAAGVAIYFVIEGARDYNFRRTPDPGAVGVRALDRRRLEFTLEKPAPYFMSVANRPDANAHRMPDSGLGSGAFELEESAPNRVVLRRHTDALARRGNVARVELVRMTPDEAAAAYRRDEVDMVLLRVLGATEELSVESADAHATALTSAVYLAPNCAGRAHSLAFRRALAHSLDRRALVASLRPPASVAAGGIVPPALQGHTADIAPAFSPDEARSLMAQAEFRSPIRLATIPSWTRVAETVAEIWREHLGVKVDLIDVGTASNLVGSDVDVLLANWLPGYPDPEYYLRLLLHSESDTNFGHWSHPPFDELIERATAERDSSTRLELFHQADRLAVHEQCALIPVAYVGSFAYVKPWVHGWWEWGKSSASFADLEIDAASPRFAVALDNPTGA